eukprot:m.45237 g.45237  ORF g.45237 m.45237 type:complete len:305 (-) comp17376_c0_seq1:87-1001(-)
MGGSKSKFKDIKKTDPSLDWKIIGDLGSGSYGKVHKVQHRGTQQLAAAKIAEIKHDDHLQNFAEEVSILSTFKHSGMTNFMGGYYFQGKLWILIEVCSGGSLADIMRARNAPFSELQIRCSSFQLLTALDFLHQNFVFHRDLNASNILLSSDGAVKLADFGVSAKNKNENSRRSSFIGTPNWMAPEVIRCEKDKSQPYSSSCDIWSLGITTIELAEIKAPFSDLHPVKVLFKITSSAPPTLSKPADWSSDFPAFLTRTLHKNPSARPSARDLLHHPFCKGHSEREPLMELLKGINTEVAQPWKP